MSDSIITKIKALVGNDNVIESKPEMAKYLKGQGQPLAVVLPGDTADVSAIVKLANEANLKLTVGGRVVDAKGLEGGIAMVMSRMDKVLEMDHENLVAVVEPGILHREFIEKVTEAGLYFAPEPHNVETGSLGGCFAIGGADSKSFNFGPTRTFILGWEMVMPSGEIVDVGNKCIKNVSGYDLIHFMVGSRGTLGIFTKLIVKLLPQPEAKRAVLANFPSLQKAGSVINKIISGGTYPTRINLLNWPLAKEILADNKELPFTSGYLAMVDLEGFKESTAQVSEEIAAALKLAGAVESIIIKEEEQYESIWNSWLKVKAKLAEQQDRNIDFSVGTANLTKGLTGLEDIAGDLNAYPGLVVCGLMGNVVVATENLSAKEMDDLLQKINKLALSLGGNVSGTLGSKLKFDSLNDPEIHNELINLVNRVRSEFDPKGVLAPGVTL